MDDIALTLVSVSQPCSQCGSLQPSTAGHILASAEEYALRNVTTPMGISEFRHLEQLPEQLKGTLPTIEQIEAELEKSQEAAPE